MEHGFHWWFPNICPTFSWLQLATSDFQIFQLVKQNTRFKCRSHVVVAFPWRFRNLRKLVCWLTSFLVQQLLDRSWWNQLICSMQKMCKSKQKLISQSFSRRFLTASNGIVGCLRCLFEHCFKMWNPSAKEKHLILLHESSWSAHILSRQTPPQDFQYCWWTKSCTTKDDDYPIIYRVLTIPGGAGFRPSTVSISDLTKSWSSEQLPACAQFNFPGPSWASRWNAQNFPWKIFIPQQCNKTLAEQFIFGTPSSEGSCWEVSSCGVGTFIHH